jgi:hypothetical protein
MISQVYLRRQGKVTDYFQAEVFPANESPAKNLISNGK